MLSRFLTILLLSLCAASGAFAQAVTGTPAAAPAPVAASGMPKIAVVDIEKILSEGKASQSLQKQIQAKKEAFQKEFAQKETQMKTTETDLITQKDKLTPEEFEKKRKAYEQSILDTRKLFQKRRSSLDEGLAKAMAQLRKSIVESAAAVADEKKIDIVLTRESVIIAEKTLDITDEVLTRLDQKLTDVKLQVQ